MNLGDLESAAHRSSSGSSRSSSTWAAQAGSAPRQRHLSSYSRSDSVFNLVDAAATTTIRTAAARQDASEGRVLSAERRSSRR
jgi:hypothetical protein